MQFHTTYDAAEYARTKAVPPIEIRQLRDFFETENQTLAQVLETIEQPYRNALEKKIVTLESFARQVRLSIPRPYKSARAYFLDATFFGIQQDISQISALLRETVGDRDDWHSKLDDFENFDLNIPPQEEDDCFATLAGKMNNQGTITGLLLDPEERQKLDLNLLEAQNLQFEGFAHERGAPKSVTDDPFLNRGRDPTFNWGLTLQTNQAGHLLRIRYSCCGMPRGHKGCWIRGVEETKVNNALLPVKYDFKPNWDAPRIWEQILEGSMSPQKFRGYWQPTQKGDAWINPSYYNNLHAQILRLKQILGTKIFAIMEDAYDKPFAIQIDVPNMFLLKKIYRLQNVYNRPHCGEKIIYDEAFIKKDLFGVQVDVDQIVKQILLLTYSADDKFGTIAENILAVYNHLVERGVDNFNIMSLVSNSLTKLFLMPEWDGFQEFDRTFGKLNNIQESSFFIGDMYLYKSAFDEINTLVNISIDNLLVNYKIRTNSRITNFFKNNVFEPDVVGMQIADLIEEIERKFDDLKPTVNYLEIRFDAISHLENDYRDSIYFSNPLLPDFSNIIDFQSEIGNVRALLEGELRYTQMLQQLEGSSQLLAEASLLNPEDIPDFQELSALLSSQELTEKQRDALKPYQEWYQQLLGTNLTLKSFLEAMRLHVNFTADQLLTMALSEVSVSTKEVGLRSVRKDINIITEETGQLMNTMEQVAQLQADAPNLQLLLDISETTLEESERQSRVNDNMELFRDPLEKIRELQNIPKKELSESRLQNFYRIIVVPVKLFYGQSNLELTTVQQDCLYLQAKSWNVDPAETQKFEGLYINSIGFNWPTYLKYWETLILRLIYEPLFDVGENLNSDEKIIVDQIQQKLIEFCEPIVKQPISIEKTLVKFPFTDEFEIPEPVQISDFKDEKVLISEADFKFDNNSCWADSALRALFKLPQTNLQKKIQEKDGVRLFSKFAMYESKSPISIGESCNSTDSTLIHESLLNDIHRLQNPKGELLQKCSPPNVWGKCTRTKIVSGNMYSPVQVMKMLIDFYDLSSDIKFESFPLVYSDIEGNPDVIILEPSGTIIMDSLTNEIDTGTSVYQLQAITVATEEEGEHFKSYIFDPVIQKWFYFNALPNKNDYETRTEEQILSEPYPVAYVYRKKEEINDIVEQWNAMKRRERQGVILPQIAGENIDRKFRYEWSKSQNEPKIQTLWKAHIENLPNPFPTTEFPDEIWKTDVFRRQAYISYKSAKQQERETEASGYLYMTDLY